MTITEPIVSHPCCAFDLEKSAACLPETGPLDRRQNPRAVLEIPIQFYKEDMVLSGCSRNMSAEGLGVTCESQISAGAPVDLQCAFGEMASLNISGLVVYCMPVKGGAYAVGIKFTSIENLESAMLLSTIEGGAHTTEIEGRAILRIAVSISHVGPQTRRVSVRSRRSCSRGSVDDLPGSAPPSVATRRVVITGIGAIAPNGIGRQAFWKGLAEGKNCVDRISFFDPTDHPSQIAAEIRDFDPLAYIPPKEVKRMGRSAHIGIAAAMQAVEDASLKLNADLKSAIGVIVGTGTSGLEYAEEDFYAIQAGGVRRMRPYAAIAGFGGALSSEISRALGLTGRSLTISTGCTGATDAMGMAFSSIRHGTADMILTGGSDACVTPGILGAFCQIGAPCTSFNSTPTKASRPFNKDRDGFVLAEGAWMFIFEELTHALRRGRRIYGEVAGYAATCDAYHMSRPLPSGQYSAQAMRQALHDASIRATDVDYINAYGNATRVNDSYESMVIHQVFEEHAKRLMVSSIKSMIGHSIGSCGAGGVAATLMAISEGLVPPTINYEVTDPECNLDYVPNQARVAQVKVALCNTIAFGSKNSVLILKKYDPDD